MKFFLVCRSDMEQTLKLHAEITDANSRNKSGPPLFKPLVLSDLEGKIRSIRRDVIGPEDAVILFADISTNSRVGGPDGRYTAAIEALKRLDARAFFLVTWSAQGGGLSEIDKGIQKKDLDFFAEIYNWKDLGTTQKLDNLGMRVQSVVESMPERARPLLSRKWLYAGLVVVLLAALFVTVVQGALCDGEESHRIFAACDQRCLDEDAECRDLANKCIVTHKTIHNDAKMKEEQWTTLLAAVTNRAGGNAKTKEVWPDMFAAIIDRPRGNLNQKFIKEQEDCKRHITDAKEVATEAEKNIRQCSSKVEKCSGDLKRCRTVCPPSKRLRLLFGLEQWIAPLAVLCPAPPPKLPLEYIQ